MTDVYDQPLVLLAGDLHGNPFALNSVFQEAHLMGCCAIIQLGDYGFGWSYEDAIGGKDADICDYSYLTGSMVEKTGIPFYWLDGNHENFDRLYALPLNDEGHRPIVEGVTHLPRGSTLTIGQTKFLAFGGAYSVDKDSRTPGRSYWPQETVTPEDVLVGYAAGPADVFLSHDVPYGTQDERDMFEFQQMWGITAVQRSVANSLLVREVLDACGAQEAFHGHIHRSYERILKDTKVRVRSLSFEGNLGSTFILAV